MSMTFALNPLNHDMFVKNGKLFKITGAQEVRQRIIISLLHEWEEYFLNMPAGLPWYQFILGSKDIRTVEALIRDNILNVPGVISINRLEMKYAARQLSFELVVLVQGLAGPEIAGFANLLLIQDESLRLLDSTGDGLFDSTGRGIYMSGT